MKYNNLEECANAIDNKALEIDANFASSLSIINSFFRWKLLIHTYFLYIPLIIGVISNFYGYRKYYSYGILVLLIISFVEGIFENIIRSNFNDEWKRAKYAMAEKEFQKNANFYNYSDSQKSTIFNMQILPLIGLSSDIKRNNGEKDTH